MPINIKYGINGNVSSADKLTTPRALTIGNTGKNFDGSSNISWSLSEIGAAASNHTHSITTTSTSGYMSSSDKTK